VSEPGEAGLEVAQADVTSAAPEAVYDLLASSPDGLSQDEAVVRLAAYGENEIATIRGEPLYRKFLSQFTHFFAALLWVAFILSFVAGMPELAWAIFFVIGINGTFSFWQEYKAERSAEALRKLLPYVVKVLRAGQVVEVEARSIVPGDVVLLAEGDRVPADMRLVESFDLQVDNSILTGESRPVRKTSAPFAADGLAWREMPNICFGGTTIVSGSGKGVVFATGMRMEFGKIAGLAQSVQEDLSPLQKEMVFVTRVIAALAIGMGVLFFVLGTAFAGLKQYEGFIFAIGIIVANVPEGLLPTVTLSLAMAVQRMAARNALVKKLSSVETLGSCTVICTDKTGTLTQNEMTATRVWAFAEYDVTGTGYEPRGALVREGKELAYDSLPPDVQDLLKAAALCNNARLVEPRENEGWKIIGDPTEGALLVLARKGGFSDEEARRWRRLRELPFDSRRKRMTVIATDGERLVALVKGAPDEVVKRSRYRMENGAVRDLSARDIEEIEARNRAFAEEAFRVLALACRELPPDTDLFALDIEDVEKDLVFLGLAALLDPPRPEVLKAVEECHEAGIRIIMITGDHGLTAEAIGRKVGMVRERARIFTGADLARMTDEEILSELTHTHSDVIFARVSPEDKLRIVSVLKESGEVVAVTGDGVNDAPALKKADIGVAMGLKGTDVAKEAADMILLDDNFATIVNAIEEGRAVFDNIRRFITYIFASNIPEIVPYLVFVLSGGAIPLPLTVLQILAVDLGTDMVPALALGAELPERDVMRRPPRRRTDRLLSWPVLARAYGFLGIIEAIACMSGYFFAYWRAGWVPGAALAGAGAVYEKARTMCLAGVVTTQIGNGFACRATRESIFTKGFFTNRLYLIGILSELTLISLFVYLPFFQRLFGHRPLGVVDWAFLFLWTPIILLADEARKALARHREHNRTMMSASAESTAKAGE